MALKIITKEEKTNDIIVHQNVEACARHFGIQKGRVKNLIKDRQKFKGWTFNIKG